MYKSIIKFSILVSFGFILTSCTKEVPKELLNNQKPQQDQQQNQQPVDKNVMPDDSIHKNLGKNNSQDDTQGDTKAIDMMKAADDAEAKYVKSKSDADKKEYITKQMGAANYLMFEANLSPKKKYKPALQRYNKVLEIDPKNAEAMENKKQIEDIYQSMGMPIPN
jgi:tetratricopeptide (TPR) repeat protein